MYATCGRVAGQAVERVERLNTQPFDVEGVTSGNPPLLTDIAILVRDVPIPADAGTLKVEIDTALNIIKSVMADRMDSPWPVDLGILNRARQAQHDYLRQLKGIAETGLMTPEPTRVAFARIDLTRLKNLFVMREAGVVKNGYVRTLGVWSALAALCFLGIYYVARMHLAAAWPHTQAWDSTVYDLRNFALLAAGTAVGTWLSFSLRRQELAFEDLAVLEPDRLSPGIRMLYMIGLATLLGLLLFTGAVIAGLGTVKGLEAMHINGSWALLIGVLSGIAERALGTAVTRTGTSFAAGIGGAEPARVRV